MKKKNLLSKVIVYIICLSLIVPCGNVSAMTVLETNVETASDGCTMLGVYGNYYSQAQEALGRINEIRREACDAGNVPDPRNPSKMLTSDDYIPIMWSKDLESIARIRAAEGGLAFGFLSSGHDRLNGKGTFSIQYNGVQSYAEDLAYNWGTSMVSGINQWYEEMGDWVNQVSGAVTGHYTSMINPDYAYVGLGDFYTKEASYPNTLAGEFCDGSQDLDQTMQEEQADVMQKIEVSNSYIAGYILEGSDTVRVGETTELAVKANLINGSKTHKLWVVDSVSYTSSDISVAQVTDSGVVTGLQGGTVTITVKSGNEPLADIGITIVSPEPTVTPSEVPMVTPSATPTVTPSATPTVTPSATPTVTPSATPTVTPSATPTVTPSATPTVTPTVTPSATPTATPSATPTVTPGTTPSTMPIVTPSVEPTAAPGIEPTVKPVETPTAAPDIMPTIAPDTEPTVKPSTTPGKKPKISTGKKVTVKGVNYKVTSVKGTRKVECTGAKKNLSSIVIPSTVKISGAGYKVTSIAANAFKGNKKISKVTIGANVKKIGKNAFLNCKNLKLLEIKTKKLTAKTVGKNAFKGINSKAIVKVPSGKVKAYNKLLNMKGYYSRPIA